MVTELTVDADLEFSVDIPGARSVTGSLTGSGTALELRVDHPTVLAGRSDAAAIRGVARMFAERGLSISVITPAGPLVTLGSARTSWLQRRVTGSRHIRIERGAGLWSLFRGRRQARSVGALPVTALAPPATLFPLAPTMARRRRRPVTTTHDPDRGGDPRLILPLGPHPWVGERPKVFPLRDGVTTIGSGADCDIRLPGLEPIHAEVRHDDMDDFVVVRKAIAGRVRVHGADVDTKVLNTGSRLDLDTWQLSYFREEYADHGRPYGGRIGGELGHQRPQPSREQMLRPTEDRQ
jgi:hypothetical protein